jgi:hypothetical protein
MAKVNAQAIRGTEGRSLVTSRLKKAMKMAYGVTDAGNDIIQQHFPHTSRIVDKLKVRDHLQRG